MVVGEGTLWFATSFPFLFGRFIVFPFAIGFETSVVFAMIVVVCFVVVVVCLVLFSLNVASFLFAFGEENDTLFTFLQHDDRTAFHLC